MRSAGGGGAVVRRKLRWLSYTVRGGCHRAMRRLKSSSVHVIRMRRCWCGWCGCAGGASALFALVAALLALACLMTTGWERQEHQQVLASDRPWLGISSAAPTARQLMSTVLRNEAATALPNLPLELLYPIKRKTALVVDNNYVDEQGTSWKCPLRLPVLDQILFSNDLWQEFAPPPPGEEVLWLFSAHLDTRDPSGDVVRILLATNGREVREGLQCQFWYRQPSGDDDSADKTQMVGKVETTQANQFAYLFLSPDMPDRKDLPYYPATISCPLPPASEDSSEAYPSVVSLSASVCKEPRNALKVRQKKKGNVAKRKQDQKLIMCVSALIYTKDVSLKLVEWMEHLREQGFDKVAVYVYYVHPNVRRVLDHYAATDFADLHQFSLSGTQPTPLTSPWLLQAYFERQRRFTMYQHFELISRHDCLYQYMDDYEYVAIMDTDELLVPTQAYDIKSLLSKYEEEFPGSTSFNFESIFYPSLELAPSASRPMIQVPGGTLPDNSEAFYMMHQTFRGVSVADRRNKSIHRSDSVVTMTSHEAKTCVGGRPCRQENLDVSHGHVHHYRDACKKLYADCSELDHSLQEDTSILKYAEAVAQRIVDVLDSLDLEV